MRGAGWTYEFCGQHAYREYAICGNRTVNGGILGDLSAAVLANQRSSLAGYPIVIRLNAMTAFSAVATPESPAIPLAPAYLRSFAGVSHRRQPCRTRTRPLQDSSTASPI